MSKLLIVVIFLAGCASTRETSKLAIMSQQASTAGARLATKLAATELTAEQRKAVEQIAELCKRSAEAMGPVVRVLGPPAPGSTSTEDTDSFTKDMLKQQGKAEVEAESVEQQRLFIEQFSSVGSGVLSQLLLGLGGTGVVGTLVMRLLQYKKSVKDAVECGDDLAEAMTPEEIKSVKQKHALRQHKNGTKGIIEKALS